MAVLPVIAQEDSTAVLGVHPFDSEQNTVVSPRYAHWSIIPHVGFNIFDGDFNGETKHPISYPSAGLDLEYTFTPVWGLGVEYMYTRYGVAGNPNYMQTVDTLLLGHMHKAGGYLAMDLVGLFYPHNDHKVLSLDAMIGGGYGWYKSVVMYHDDKDGTKNATHERGRTKSYVNNDGVLGPDKMTSYKGAPFFQFGLNIEFNLNRTLALGLRGAYYYYLTDEIDGRGYAGEKGIQSKNNDGLLDVTLNMRIKLTGKEHSHVRNIGGDEPNLEIAKHITAMENPSYAPGGRDTLVISHRDTVVEIHEVRTPAERQVIVQQLSSPASAAPANYYIYYRPGKSTLDDAALATIQQVADRMKADETLYAVVTGYCDNTGSDSYNFALGDRRADNVIEELNEEYDIPIERLYAGSVGKLVGKRSAAAYGPNRRALIQLVNEETFVVLTAELEQRRSLREAEQQPLGEPVQAETAVLNAPAPVAGEQTAVVEKTTTLSKLARKYYNNNTHCWVYIYLANEDIVNPNALRPGMTLRIPELTPEQLTITREACAELYSSNQRQ